MELISEVRDRLRDLRRYRTNLVQEYSRRGPRVQGVIGRANMKLATITTDLMWVSASAIFAAARGKKRGIVAVATSTVVSAFHMLARHEAYREVGSNSFDEHRRAHRVDRLRRRIERLG